MSIWRPSLRLLNNHPVSQTARLLFWTLSRDASDPSELTARLESQNSREKSWNWSKTRNTGYSHSKATLFATLMVPHGAKEHGRIGFKSYLVGNHLRSNLRAYAVPLQWVNHKQSVAKTLDLIKASACRVNWVPELNKNAPKPVVSGGR